MYKTIYLHCLYTSISIGVIFFQEIFGYYGVILNITIVYAQGYMRRRCGVFIEACAIIRVKKLRFHILNKEISRDQQPNLLNKRKTMFDSSSLPIERRPRLSELTVA
jgi:hypothetical protein